MGGPRISHHDVLAAGRAAGVEIHVHRITGASGTSEQAAATLGCRVEQIVKSILFITASGPVLVLQSGPRRTDTKLLAGALGVARSSIRLATPEETLQIAAAPVGHVPPAGHPSRIRTLVDESCLWHDRIYFAAAEAGVLLSSGPGDLLKLTGAPAAALSK
jgi:prolyl-tRNA editing enzyme YbaK/EbsC (Cys-tRNA(Pro) deacylase)